MGGTLVRHLVPKLSFAMISALVLVAMHFGAARVTAQGHTVLVEGNCDSPVPGTTLVAPGTCGDFDGDGRIGTAEDTDGADRIFGTINAALGSGTGAAAGTGINNNGRILITSSGRFYESIYIGHNQCGQGCPGVANPGNVTLEAAPGVSATIDAVFQGDPGGGNGTRLVGTGINVAYLPGSSVGLSRLVTLRNLTIRNYARGLEVSHNARVLVDNCKFEGNQNYGVVLNFGSLVEFTNSVISGTGTRTAGPATTSAHGLYMDTGAQARVVDTAVSHNLGVGVYNNTGNAANLVVFKLNAYFNGLNIAGGFTNNLDPNLSTN